MQVCWEPELAGFRRPVDSLCPAEPVALPLPPSRSPAAFPLACQYGSRTCLPAYLGALSLPAAGVATHAVGCVHVLGCNLPPRHWMPLAAEALAAEQQGAAQRTAALVVLSGLLYAAPASAAGLDSDTLQLCAATLSGPGLAAAAVAPDGGALRQQLLAACSNLVRWAGPGIAAVGSQLFGLLLQLWSVEVDGSADQATQGSSGSAAAAAGSAAAAPTAAAVLEQLAATLGRASAAGLCDLYGTEMLRCCTQVSCCLLFLAC